MKDILTRFTSRKFLLALVGILSAFFKDSLHLSPDQLQAVVTLIIAFTAAEGAADIVTRYNEPQA